ncbi:hypothetical protein BFU36_01385 [Sulfolobus sp. A20]|uniref:hypothetical protein n=1 Tax=Sulfolobaceae TaxID=118883 RepID=UPI000845E462|nr:MULTISPECIES: hypothetical protein [unclassified Sulfolobus]TRM75771.1 hypothetical protein DJ528_09035 [Sulfolobus sp. B5]TRM77189.1 hypothetical protein DJ532_05645 [Sulfolobus sp. A20-N-F8]TRM80698.1 hypothetical protein DJ524_06730 [Sulfolobus sp. D5]TRM87842.1 hypothetical protein DJ529_07255 [Sulfolobus sp. C3]TRM97923.1 hypothetical protein DJ530_11750 [Sulfolobus sp. E1]TRN02566.1 hypothetical protein DJ527_03505 [Sulfolobus sp. F1]
MGGRRGLESTSNPPLPISASDVSALGAMIQFTLDYTTIRDQGVCTGRGLKKVLESEAKYEVYPALTVSGRVSTSTTNIFQILRHGIIIRTAEGNYYYIGGKSNYWIQDRALHAYQGGTEFVLSSESGSRLFKEIRDSPSNIVVLQVRGIRISGTWYQPSQLEGCQTPVLGWIMEWIQSTSGVGAGVIMNYVAQFTDLRKDFIEVPGNLVYESGGHYTTDPLQAILRSFSTKPPFPYFMILTKIVSQLESSLGIPLQIPYSFGFVLFPASVMKDFCEFFLVGKPQEYCNYLVSDTTYNESIIGAPIFSSIICPSGCKRLGLAGLVYKGQMVGDFLGLAYVKPPTDYTDAGIQAYAQELGVSNALQISKSLVGGASRAEAELISVFGLSATVASAIINVLVTWYEDWQRVFEEAKPYAEEARNVVNEVRDFLNKIREYRLLSYVDECLAETIISNEPLEYWYDATKGCVTSKLG